MQKNGFDNRMNEKPSKENNPLKKVWGVLSVPLSTLGLLGLSDSLINFHVNIQNLINSYKSIVHPVFELVFFWAWFEVPGYVYDYLFIGSIFASYERRVWGFMKVSDNQLKHWLLHIKDFSRSILFWPVISAWMAYQIYQTNSEGLITSLTKGPKPFYVKYNFRNQDILVFRYIASAFILFLLVVIINYTYYMSNA
jgi:hypothetical protein